MTPGDEKIQPRLWTVFEQARLQMVARQAEAMLSVETAGEHIEEREYDEEQRLRTHRVIDRHAERCTIAQRWSSLAAEWRSQGIAGESLAKRMRDELGRDLDRITGQAGVRDLPGLLRHYGERTSAGDWPAVLCLASSPGQVAGLRQELSALGFPQLPSPRLERFGILKVACPPEHTVLRELASRDSVAVLSDPATPVSIPTPSAVRVDVADARTLLGVTGDVADRFGEDVTLAILDTGLDLTHAAFARVAPDDYRNFTPVDAEDTEGHGTHVAAIAAGDDPAEDGRYRGVAPKVRLVAGKVISGLRVGELEQVLEGMAWAVFEKRVDLISLSLGDAETPPNGTSIWTRACDEAFRQGTLVCAAAGNTEPAYPETVVVPGDSRTAVTVGAVDKMLHLAPFSAQGSENPDSPLRGKPDCVAPGVAVVAARSSRCDFPSLPDGDAQHTALSGTSMSTPAVAGCAALVKSKARSIGWEMTSAELREALLESCKPLTDEHGTPYRTDTEIGRGLIDVAGAFAWVEEHETGRTHAVASAGAAIGPRVPTTMAPATAARIVVPGSGTATGQAAAVRAADAPVGDPDTCYACGRRYVSRTGVFSPGMVCRVCGRPICAVCWAQDLRCCDGHKQGVASTDGSTGTRLVQTQDGHVMELCEAFFSRFEQHVREAGRVTSPPTGHGFDIAADITPQEFSRVFGRVKQFRLEQGLLAWKRKMRLVAVCLAAGGSGVKGDEPAPDVLQQIAGAEGLAFEPETFYAVGVFSPVGWPDSWRTQEHARGNAVFYLVSHAGGTRWRVSGQDDSLATIFSPESDTEQARRVAQLLAELLVVPGDLTGIDALERDHDLRRQAIDAAVENSRGRWQVIEYKGRTAIQRSLA